jgi:Mitochondrial carrier protein
MDSLSFSSLSLIFFFYLSLPPFNMSKAGDTKPKTLMTHLIAGGSAGLVEACTCHPLDTIKVRMQLSKSGSRSKGVMGHDLSIQCTFILGLT